MWFRFLCTLEIVYIIIQLICDCYSIAIACKQSERQLLLLLFKVQSFSPAAVIFRTFLSGTITLHDHTSRSADLPRFDFLSCRDFLGKYLFILAICTRADEKPLMLPRTLSIVGALVLLKRRAGKKHESMARLSGQYSNNLNIQYTHYIPLPYFFISFMWIYFFNYFIFHFPSIFFKSPPINLDIRV